jgi:Na+/alanine symporter
MDGFFSAFALLIAVLLLGGFYNIHRRVGQIRDDHHALRVMIEEELKRAARDRYASSHPAP